MGISKRYKISHAILLCISIILPLVTGCINPKLPDSFPYHIMMREKDLPQEFHFKSSNFPPIDSGIAYYVSFQVGNDEIAQFIAQDITIFSDETTAFDQYQERANTGFITGAYDVTSSGYEPKSKNDIYTYKCIDEVVNNSPNKLCEIYQVHQNLIMHVLVHINANTMTQSEFENILSVLDHRLPEGLTPLPND